MTLRHWMAMDVLRGGTRGRRPSSQSDGGIREGLHGARVLIATMRPPNGRGGIQAHMASVGQMMSQRHIPVHVVHPGSWAPAVAIVVLSVARVLRHSGSETGVRSARLWHRVLLGLALRRELRGAAHTVVYAQDPRSAYAAVRARKRALATVVMVVHYNGSQADELVERGSLDPHGKAERAIRDFEAALLPQLDGIVYVSEFMRQRVQHDVPKASRVPSAIIPNFLPPVAGGTPSAHSPLRDCISVGYLTPRKNHAYLLHVLAAARGAGHLYTLTIVGEGAEQKPLERLALDLGIADQVVFTGARDDIPELLSRHRLYVHSSKLENCPFALIEAFRQGLPVIAAPVGGVAEVLGAEGPGRFWELDQPEAGAVVLSELLDDEQALRHASEAARTRFATTFAADVAGEQLLSFLATTARPIGLIAPMTWQRSESRAQSGPIERRRARRHGPDRRGLP